MKRSIFPALSNVVLLLVVLLARTATAQALDWGPGERVVVLGAPAATETTHFIHRVKTWIAAAQPQVEMILESGTYNNVHTFLANFEQVVAQHRPTVVLINLTPVNLWPLYRGVGSEQETKVWELDTLHSNAEALQRYETNLAELGKRCKQAGARQVLIVLTPDIGNFPLHETALLDALRAATKDVAQRGDMVVLDVARPFRAQVEAARRDGAPLRYYDGGRQVTPNDAGQLALAEHLAALLGLPGHASETPPVPPAQPLNAADDEPVVQQEMVAVPGGSFTIDKYETTCAMYLQFVAATKHAPPGNWPAGRYLPGMANVPVTHVTRADAEAYATWAGKRLPTAQEWELAAKGATAGNMFEARCWRPVRVGSFPGGGAACGALDMIGNVWEWTTSAHPAFADMTIVKGAGWEMEANFPGTSYANSTHQGKAYVTARTDSLGFRCVQ